jgi:hypothetical protein
VKQVWASESEGGKGDVGKQKKHADELIEEGRSTRRMGKMKGKNDEDKGPGELASSMIR